jgi:hypothetical protein
MSAVAFGLGLVSTHRIATINIPQAFLFINRGSFMSALSVIVTTDWHKLPLSFRILSREAANIRCKDRKVCNKKFYFGSINKRYSSYV